MQRRRAAKNLPPLGKFVMSAYVIVRDTEAEAQAELERIAAEVFPLVRRTLVTVFLHPDRLVRQLPRAPWAGACRPLRFRPQ